MSFDDDDFDPNKLNDDSDDDLDLGDDLDLDLGDEKLLDDFEDDDPDSKYH